MTPAPAECPILMFAIKIKVLVARDGSTLDKHGRECVIQQLSDSLKLLKDIELLEHDLPTLQQTSLPSVQEDEEAVFLGLDRSGREEPAKTTAEKFSRAAVHVNAWQLGPMPHGGIFTPVNLPKAQNQEEVS